jgi:hypothetical protein
VSVPHKLPIHSFCVVLDAFTSSGDLNGNRFWTCIRWLDRMPMTHLPFAQFDCSLVSGNKTKSLNRHFSICPSVFQLLNLYCALTDLPYVYLGYLTNLCKVQDYITSRLYTKQVWLRVQIMYIFISNLLQYSAVCFGPAIPWRKSLRNNVLCRCVYTVTTPVW